MKLSDMIDNPAVKTDIVEDCIKLIDAQVASKGGLGGMALKTAYKVVNGVGAGYVAGAIGRMLPETFVALTPIWNEGLQTGNPVNYLTEHRSRTADIILGVTDARLHRANSAVTAAYKQLRKSVKQDVELAVPELASIIGNHMQVLHHN
jgi:hypothetical protein